jgi:hypothetical protein
MQHTAHGTRQEEKVTGSIVIVSLTSGLGELSWNWINPILAFSIRVGPPALAMTPWLSARPSTSSVSSMVPPTFFTIRMSRRSTLEEVGVTRRVTAETAMGARVEEYCDTIWTGQRKSCFSIPIRGRGGGGSVSLRNAHL